MAKRTVRKPSGAASSIGVTAMAEATAEGTLATIFASIRDGKAPWTLDQLPSDTGATTVLLSELDRLWQNPLPN